MTSILNFRKDIFTRMIIKKSIIISPSILHIFLNIERGTHVLCSCIICVQNIYYLLIISNKLYNIVRKRISSKKNLFFRKDITYVLDYVRKKKHLYNE